MKSPAALLLGVLLLAQAPAFAQERPGRGALFQKQGLQPHDRAREDREGMRRERAERMERKDHRRFSREERDKLRQDLLDANREMKRRR
jgi:hypothetical protein